MLTPLVSWCVGSDMGGWFHRWCEWVGGSAWRPMVVRGCCQDLQCGAMK